MFGLLLDIPGRLARGNWTAALYVDERASIYARESADAHLYRQGGRLDRSLENPGQRIPRRADRADPLRNRDGTHIFQIPRSSRAWSSRSGQGRRRKMSSSATPGYWSAAM